MPTATKPSSHFDKPPQYARIRPPRPVSIQTRHPCILPRFDRTMARVNARVNHEQHSEEQLTRPQALALQPYVSPVVKADGWAEFRLPEPVPGLWRISTPDPLRKCSADFAMVPIRLAEMPVLACIYHVQLTDCSCTGVAAVQLRPLHILASPPTSARCGQRPSPRRQRLDLR